MAHLIAQSSADYMDLGCGFALVTTTPDPKYCRATLGELDVHWREGFSIAAIRGKDGERSTARAGMALHEDDLTMVIVPIKTITQVTWGCK